MTKPPETDAEIASVHVGGAARLHNDTVYLAPYDPSWPAQYEAEAAKIRAALGEEAMVLEHVGSTSIPGIPAKPVPVDAIHYSPGFMPYGTPCGEDVDPVRARLAELENEIEELRRELNDLAQHFDEAMPDDGRYVRQPAQADEDGVYRVPPPRFDFLPPLLVSAGLLALIGTRLWRERTA